MSAMDKHNEDLKLFLIEMCQKMNTQLIKMEQTTKDVQQTIAETKTELESY